MRHSDYLDLCRQASHALGLEDTEELGLGHTVELDGVLFEALYEESVPAVLLLAELGHVADPHRVHVYEQLLTLQLLNWYGATVYFGFHPARRTALLCQKLTLGENTRPAALAEVMQTTARQVLDWRENLLAGKVGDSDDVSQTPPPSGISFPNNVHV